MKRKRIKKLTKALRRRGVEVEEYTVWDAVADVDNRAKRFIVFCNDISMHLHEGCLWEGGAPTRFKHQERALAAIEQTKRRRPSLYSNAFRIKVIK